MKNNFIVIEGLDGVGKTTVSNLLAKRLGGVAYKTPPNIFQKIRKVISLKNPKFRFYFFLLSLFLASIEISILKRKQHVICDRYLYSTIAYHKAASVNVFSRFSFWKRFILRPDKCFYLWARPEILEKRINFRKYNSIGDIIVRDDRELRVKIHKNFLELKYLFGLEIIDVSEINLEDVVNFILKQQG